MRKNLILSIITFMLLFAIVFTNASPVNAYPAAYYLNVSVVQQPYSYWCWAACGACVVQYVRNTSTVTPSHFAYAVQHNYSNSARTLAEIQDGLEFYYITDSNIYYSIITITNNTVTVNALSYSTVANEIWGEKPIIAARYPYQVIDGELYIGIGHDYVIEGYYTEDGAKYLSLMNPASTTLQSAKYTLFKKNYYDLWGGSIYSIYYNGV